MERCDRCKKTTRNPRKFAEFELCFGCYRGLDKFLMEWMTEGLPPAYACGCMTKLYDQSAYREVLAVTKEKDRVSYLSSRIAELQTEISRCKHPGHEAYWSAPDRKRVI
jgi:hypothetical protein